MAHKKNEQQEYVSLPYFGINKLLPFLKPYRFILFSMIFLGLTGGLVDIILPLFQRYALNYFIANETLATLALPMPVFYCFRYLQIQFRPTRPARLKCTWGVT